MGNSFIDDLKAKAFGNISFIDSVRQGLYIIMLAILILSCLNSLAAEFGNVQLSVASPDPVRAGDKVTFQVVAINTGTEEWKKDEYAINGEIYDKDKKYLRKTRDLFGKVLVVPGQSTLLYLSYDVPEDFAGLYYYKINLKYKGKVIAISKFYTFNVSPITIIIPEIELVGVKKRRPPFKFNGNLSLSFRNDSEVGSTYSLYTNLIGQAAERSLSFTADLDFDDEDGFERNNLLLSYYGKKWNTFLGDVTPSFSELTLDSVTILGLHSETGWNKYNFSIIGALSQEAEEPDTTSSGTYAQTLYGLRIDRELPRESNLGISFITACDDEGSISNPGSYTTPQANTVIGIDGSTNWLEWATLSLEYAQSNYDEDTTDDISEKTDSAFKIGAQTTIGDFPLELTCEKVGSDYISLGSPSSIQDRAGYGVSSSYAWGISNLSLGYNKYNDNVEDDPTKIRTDYNTLNGGLNFNFQKFPSLSVYYNVYDMLSDEGAIDNMTKTLSLSSNYAMTKLNNTSLSAYYQKSDFSDNTNISSDLSTTTTNFGINTFLWGKLSLNSGLTLSTIGDLGNGSDTDSNSTSIGLTYTVIPDKLTLSGWYSLTNRSDGANTVDTKDSTGNLEVTYNLNENLALALGYEMIDYTDNLEETNSYDENIVNFRVSYNF